jgi:hypothetical protein
MKLVINDITENRMSIKKSAQKHDLSNSDFHLSSKTWFNKHFFRRRGGTPQGLPFESSSNVLRFNPRWDSRTSL